MLCADFGVNEVPFTRHQAVIGQTDAYVINPDLITMRLFIVYNFWFHDC